jgi:hypothetical protein
MHNLVEGNGPFEAWLELEHVVRTGEPAIEKIYHQDFFSFIHGNPTASELLNDVMGAWALATTPVITASYDWSTFPVIADIGGGIGNQLVSVLDASTTSKGILFDLPHVESQRITHDRVQFVAGDFFDSVPANADAYILRWILHDWSDVDSARILQVLRQTMKPHSRLIIVESVIPEDETYHPGKWIDLQMMVALKGRERTEKEFRALLLREGFIVDEVITTACPLSLIVARCN